MSAFSKRTFIACTALTAVLSPQMVLAQSADAVASPGDIIVIANKRSENLIKVGASVAAFDARMLENRNIVTPQKLVRAIPGMALAPSTHGTPVYTLRGIGYNADALGVYPAVSVSID